MERDRTFAVMTGLVLGATAMYFFDPRSGRRRRALVRDQFHHASTVVEGSVERLAHDLANRTRGTVARTRRMLSPEQMINDQRLEARVRSTLGRLTSRAGAIEVLAREGMITLSGQIPACELGYVLTGIRRVPGVQRLESRLKALPRETNAPPETAPRVGMPPDLLQAQMSPTGRAMVGTAGAALTVAGAKQGGIRGILAAVLGGAMVVRALTNETPRALVTPTDRTPVNVRKTIEVSVPVRRAFALWSNFREFPRFMRHLREVTESESGISHWVADGPAGLPVTWDAEILRLEPHRRISWRSIPGSPVFNAGEVRFEDVTEDCTRIHVHMVYSPPGGAVGHAVASLFGADPKRQLDDDLGRLKALLEQENGRSSGRSDGSRATETRTSG